MPKTGIRRDIYSCLLAYCGRVNQASVRVHLLQRQFDL